MSDLAGRRATSAVLIAVVTVLVVANLALIGYHWSYSRPCNVSNEAVKLPTAENSPVETVKLFEGAVNLGNAAAMEAILVEDKSYLVTEPGTWTEHSDFASRLQWGIPPVRPLGPSYYGNICEMSLTEISQVEAPPDNYEGKQVVALLARVNYRFKVQPEDDSDLYGLPNSVGFILTRSTASEPWRISSQGHIW